jgi:exopolysaccharide biosynthesis WecB/TagA/CpsF family protein
MKHAAFQTQFDLSEAIAMPRLATTHLPALGFDLVDASANQAINHLLSPGRRRAFFMNAHCCNVRRSNLEYRRAVSAADVLLPDGIGVALAARMTGQKLTENLNGTDLVPTLLRRAARMGKSVYLFGGKPGTAAAAANRLIHTIPGLHIAGTRDGFAGAADDEAVIADINESGADIVLVALGVPMQEIWLHRHASRLDASLTLGVGALFDFLAGSVVRAPKMVRRARMEWVWRLAQEPRRLAKRYLAGNFAFLAHAAMKTIARTPVADMQRRVLDITVSASALLVLSPLLILTAIAIKLDSRGPILFRQTRIGQDGVPFTMLKFRSMTTDAETRQTELLSTSDRAGVCFKSRNDPRITQVGRFIRRFSIDELPQIVNVLRGEMAIVGPRPALPREVAAYSKRAIGRLAVKPGITGVWQVSGRANIGFDQMVEMDISYAASRTLLVDIVLILRTFGAVATARGAY